MTAEQALIPLLVSLGGLIGVALSASRSIDNRFAQIKAELQEEIRRLSVEAANIRGLLELNTTRDRGAIENLEYRIHANTELINHRTARFKEELGRVEGAIGVDVKEIKGYLARETNFVIRDRRPPEA